MQTIINKYLPFKGFVAMTVWPYIFVRSERTLSHVTLRHEEIHGEQQKEMLLLGALLAPILAICGCGWWSLLALPLFYWWYITEWVIKAIYYRSTYTAYKNISFEREAYGGQSNVCYIDTRSPFAWFNYIVFRW